MGYGWNVLDECDGLDLLFLNVDFRGKGCMDWRDGAAQKQVHTYNKTWAQPVDNPLIVSSAGIPNNKLYWFLFTHL